MTKKCTNCNDIELRQGADTCMRCGGNLVEK